MSSLQSKFPNHDVYLQNPVLNQNTINYILVPKIEQQEFLIESSDNISFNQTEIMVQSYDYFSLNKLDLRNLKIVAKTIGIYGHKGSRDELIHKIIETHKRLNSYDTFN